jgi:succinoglycan biosynthesis transport protein ExoP
MSLIQFFRMFWARRWLVVSATGACLVGAIILTLILPPRWDSHARVMLDVMKPDPVTGLVIGTQEGRVYAATQIELITDNSIAGQVAEQLGWLTDPVLQAAYQRRSAGDQRDFRSWLSQLIVDNTKAKLIEGSNILDIDYTGTSAANAKAVADTLRKVYIQDSVLTKREDAQRNAVWYEQQTAKARAALSQAIDTETSYERANGVVMANDKIDAESARMQALTATGGVPNTVPFIAQPNSAAEMELGQINAQIAASAKVLGPNNPEMQALRSRRASVAAVAGQEKAAAREAANGANSGRGAYEQAIAAQKSKLIADSPKIAQLTELQNDVNLRRDELEKLAQKAAEYRQEALVSEAGITPIGPASTPKQAAFPNYLLIIPGAIVLGGGLGVMVALLMELLSRRVRGVEDLASLDMPVVGVIGAPRTERNGRRFRWLPRLGSGRRPVGKVVPA